MLLAAWVVRSHLERSSVNPVLTKPGCGTISTILPNECSLIFFSIICFLVFQVPTQLQPQWHRISEAFFKMFDYFGRIPVLDSVGEPLYHLLKEHNVLPSELYFASLNHSYYCLLHPGGHK